MAKAKRRKLAKQAASIRQKNDKGTYENETTGNTPKNSKACLTTHEDLSKDPSGGLTGGPEGWQMMCEMWADRY